MTSSRPGGGSTVDVTGLLALAIGFEVESAELYESLAPEAPAGPVRELVALLGRQEREHERILKEFQPPAGGKGLLQFAPELSLSMPRRPAEVDLEATLGWALARERATAAIYGAAAAAAGAGPVRGLLEGLARFEQEHVERLVSLQRYY
jgi:rubrerythrin